jgi:hypothetical protein
LLPASLKRRRELPRLASHFRQPPKMSSSLSMYGAEQSARLSVTSHPDGRRAVVYKCAIALFGALCLLALHLSISRRRKKKVTTSPPKHYPVAIQHRQHQQQHQFWLPGKSRGFLTPSLTMSRDHSPGPADPAWYRDLESGRDVLALPEQDGASEEPRVGDTMVLPLDVSQARHLKMRPPPPPPLSPPVLSRQGFPFESRRLSTAVSVVGDMDSSFFDQPNPDYTSSSGTSSSMMEQRNTSPITPRRRSYTKTIPFQTPKVAAEEADSHVPSFSPSSFPSSSPTLPLAPHDSFETREINVKGEIISVTDDSGIGWKRHTRVYGGGVCLACLAAGDQHGGYYGENVRPEEKR